MFNYIECIKKYHSEIGSDWDYIASERKNSRWIYLKNKHLKDRNQGWKIHVSLSCTELEAAFSLIFPVLFSRRVDFKIPNSFKGVIDLNSGELGSTQVGKIITIYPEDDCELIVLVSILNNVYPFSKGPLVPSDLQTQPNGAVSLRYGVFSFSEIRYDSFGRPDYYIKNPNDGLFYPDSRNQTGIQPFDITPPVQTYKKKIFEREEKLKIKGCTYILLSLITSSFKGQTFLAIDIERLNTVIIKIAQKGTFEDSKGNDTAIKLQNEYNILYLLQNTSCNVPKPISFEISFPNVFLVVEDLKGKSFEKLSFQEQCQNFPNIVKQIKAIHSYSIIHRDIKLTNLLVYDGEAYLIDFELATPISSDNFLAGGTRNYQSDFSSESYDWYSLGVTLLHIITKYDPALLTITPLDTISLLKKFYQTDTFFIIEKLLNGEAPDDNDINLLTTDLLPSFMIVPEIDANWLQKALTDSLNQLLKYFNINGSWQNTHLFSSFQMDGINLGAAGVLIGGICLLKNNCSTKIQNELLKTTNYLAMESPYEYAHGLFTGNAGIALALCVSYSYFKDFNHKDNIKLRFEAATRGPIEDYDLFSGMAGIVYTGYVLSEILNEDWPLDLARDFYDKIKKSAINVGGIISWPPSIMMESTSPYLGVAHGSSGIVIALHFFGTRINDKEGTELARKTLKSIFQNGRTPTSDSLRKTCSPTGGYAGNSAWCHGTLGYLWSILICNFEDEFKSEIYWCVEKLKKLSPIDNPTYCHGIAGRIDTIRMLSRINIYSSFAKTELNKYLNTLKFLSTNDDGNITWASENPTVISPDLWVGFMGPATAISLTLNGNCNSSILRFEWLKNDN